jgi:chromate transporter
MSDDLATLAQLFVDFARVSLLAIGGGSAALPEMHSVVVTDTHWLSNQQFKEIYSLGQVAPGPNMTMVAVIGQHVAGWAGALVALIAFFVPSSLLAFGVNRLWQRLEPWPWLESIRQGLAPVAIGLLIAGVWLLARLALEGIPTPAIASIATVVLLARHVNPLWLIIAGASVNYWLVTG